MGDTRIALAADPTVPNTDDLTEVHRILAEAGIDDLGSPGAEALAEPAAVSAIEADPSAEEPVVAAQPETTDLKFGWSYPDSASADDLIIGSDGTGYLYPSDFVHGTNGYEPD